MKNIEEIFGVYVFNDSAMRERLPAEVYESLKSTIEKGDKLDSSIADTVASAMKDWAIENGATHFTHWFQPMTGITAEKHDSFIAPAPGDKVIMEFSGKELIKGESDASSFPSGGLRATFEARGYTAWDCCSYAFIKDNTLCIPTAFCSYTGQALDEKTPLLRSMRAINTQALRLLKALGINDVKHVSATAGAEQEYFLIDKKLYDKRPDLIFTGRTLLGCPPPKGQDMTNHYFGVIKPRVFAFMRDLDEELWKLGVYAKTEHNEAAPAQHELAPIFTTVNIAADHNQLIMEMMKKVALRHDLVCLLNEKPFKGVNGSGKHNNWSLCTDTGINLLNPGKNPSENKLFLVTLAAIIQAVDTYQDLLRISTASAGNDHRLGAHEAPPAIVSIFLGEELLNLLFDIAKGVHHNDAQKIRMNIGAETVPTIKRDNSDRNRTSPFAFTGNKFEFRMPGSGASISSTNVMLNTAVADVFEEFATRLETCDDLDSEIKSIIADVMLNHSRIIFNGDGYSDEWVNVAEKRGLLNLKNTVEAQSLLCCKKNIELFARQKIFDEAELKCRYETALESYSKTIKIEANTLLQMIKRDIIPAITEYMNFLIDFKTKIPDKCIAQKQIFILLNGKCNELYNLVNVLEEKINEEKIFSTEAQKADFYCNNILPIMEQIRTISDRCEEYVPGKYWPYPGYDELLFNI